LPLHCPKCGQTFGKGKTAEREVHVQQRACRDAGPVRAAHDEIEGLDASQLVKLHRRQGRGLSETQRWYAIWNILFPAADLPDSPYIDSPEDEMLHIVLRAVKHFYSKHDASPQSLFELNWSAVCSALEYPSSGESSGQPLSEADSAVSFGSATPIYAPPGADPISEFSSDWVPWANFQVPIQPYAARSDGQGDFTFDQDLTFAAKFQWPAARSDGLCDIGSYLEDPGFPVD
jgi:hypothetical protein